MGATGPLTTTARLVLVAAGLVFALLTSRPADSAGTIATVVGVHPRTFTAAVTWEVARAARVAVAVDAGTEPALWTPAVRTSGPGRFTTELAPLEPATEYRATVIAVVGSSVSTIEARFRTGAWPVAPKSRVTPLALKVNTRPLFPRMVFAQCPSAFPASIAAGINLFMGTNCGPPQQSMAALTGRALLVPDIRTRADGPAVIGWHQLDEADLHVDRAEVLPLLPPSSRTGRTTFLTLSNHVWSGAAQLPGAKTLYPALAARAEVLGADIYPLQVFCRKELLDAVFYAQRELVALARGKPTFQWIEADRMEFCRGLDPSPAVVRAETWMAVAGGARGIGWFPENWQPAVRAEITRLARELRSLAPALLGPELPVRVLGGPVVAGGRMHGEARYVIAVNPRFTRTSARISVPGLGDGRLRVWGEDRAVTARGGIFADYFRGLQARIYVVPPPGLDG